MTALEAFNALDNREVSRKEVEQVLTQAKAENNTAIIYRLSRVLNDSPEATHFEITITHYDSPVGLSGVQHTGDYREALDDCGRLRKGWKFVKGNVVKVEEKPKKEAKPKKEKAPQKEETTKEVSGPKVKNFEAFDDLQAQLLAENADIPESEVLDFLYNFTDAFEEGKTVFRFWNTPGKKPTEAVLQYKKPPLLTRLQNPSAKMRAYELTPRGYELLEKFHKGVERIKKTYDLGYIAGIQKLYNFLRDRKAYTKKENVEDSSKKKVEKAPAKATKSLKSGKEKGENVANFTLLQEPTKVFLEFEDEKNQAYYKKSANKQGAVGADFLKKVLKDLKKQNLREEPRGFINTEDFPVSPTISKVTGIDSLKTVVVKDKNRPTLECVLIEADRYVATDLYNIILLNRSKNDGLKTGALYDPNYKCTNIGGCSKEEYYRDIEIGYLNYKAVLTENPVYTSDWGAIEPIIQHLKSGLEVIRKIYDWKKVYLVKITSNVGEGHYNLKYLLNDLQILQSNGAKKIRLYTNKLDEKLNIETDNGNIVVTMAVYMEDRSNYADVISPLRIAPIQLHFTQNRKEEKGLSGVDYSQGLFGDIGLNAPRHEGILKEALNDCGRLKKGWKFEKGKAVKVETKKGKDKEGEQKELDLYMQEMKTAIKESKAGKFDKKNILSWLSKFPDKVKGLLYNFLYHHYLLDQEEAKLRKSKKLVPFGLISVQAGISEFVSKLMDLEREDFFDLYFFFRDNMDECIELLEDKEVKKNYYEKKKKGLSGVDYSQGLFGAVPEVSTERFKKMKVNELRTFTLRYYNLFLKGDSVTIERHLKEVVFTNKAGRKIAHGEAMYSEKAAVIAQLKTLIKNSTYNNWGDRKPQDHPDILGYLNFKSKITIDGEKRHLRISIIVDKDRKLKLKSYDVGKKKSRDPQGGLPSAEGSQLFKTVQSTQDPVGTLQDGRTEPLSEGKGTKKSLSRKKKEENFGLNASEAPVTSLPAPRQTLAQQLATCPEVRESFLVADEQMSLFLGALEKKTKDSLVITLTGKQGSGKTRFAFQFMNALAQRYRVGHASIEEHPESVLYEEKAYQYLNDTALEHITAQDVRSLAELDTMIRTNEVIVIDSFQKMRELAPHFEIDKDLRKKYDGKLFLVIFQQTADGKMRGGSKSQYDGDIILFTETFPDYRENYVYPDKNRYNKRPATELQYSIYEQRMLATAPEVPALPAHYEPTESEELNFEVL
ncbi:hypothetical protein CAPGI0001_0460 [Capnocytophaga gingivalis ATCC 33624]|uniref:LPD3 domain-containing protein n=1 Tax=Capnocytophaga gingivalis TaxID=1017 RepID=UPI00019FBBC5|nr:hypothetical protein [Capnocytophaga gingivalis]EEK15224.1 hypothetical protein CAPGI0001_0460 [Capnocytophaga gingivalis ATCC 33624]